MTTSNSVSSSNIVEIASSYRHSRNFRTPVLSFFLTGFLFSSMNNWGEPAKPCIASTALSSTLIRVIPDASTSYIPFCSLSMFFCCLFFLVSAQRSLRFALHWAFLCLDFVFLVTETGTNISQQHFMAFLCTILHIVLHVCLRLFSTPFLRHPFDPFPVCGPQ